MANVITIRGVVIGAQNKKGLGGLRVEAWDKDFASKHYVASTLSERDGHFKLQFNQDHFAKIYRDQLPDLFFKVYEGESMVKTSEKETIWNITSSNLELVLEIDEKELAAAKKSYTFRGRVNQSDGSPLKDVTVFLYEVYAGGRRQVAAMTTNNDGAYFLMVNGSSLDFWEIPVFQLELEDEKGTILSSSSLLTQPPSDSFLSFEVQIDSQADPAFIRCEKSIASLLKGLDYSNLKGKARDISYLAAVSGQSDKEIERFVNAQNLSREIDVDPEVLYVLMGQGTEDLEDILSQSDENVSRALKQAAEENSISRNSLRDLDKLSQKLNAALIKQLTGKQSSNLLLQVINEKELEIYVSVYRSRNEGEESYWGSLKAQLGEEKTFGIQSALTLNSITRQQPEIAKALLSKLGEGKSRQNVKALARMNRESLEKLISEVSKQEGKLCVPNTITGRTEQEKMANYAADMVSFLRAAYPTEVFRGDLERDESSFIKDRKDLLNFFDNNLDFDFRQNLTSDLEGKESSFNFGRMTDDAKRKTLNTIKQIKRLFAVNDDYKVIGEFIRQGHDSAFSIARMPKDVFLEKYGSLYNSRASALLDYLRAHGIVAVAQELVMGLNGHMAVNAGVFGTPAAVVADPELRTMFGSLEQAEVEEWQTVHSPAAYLVDILNFLESNARSTSETFTEFKRRRGDILNIDLTDKNTFTSMPYVDLALEQMENLLVDRQQTQLQNLHNQIQNLRQDQLQGYLQKNLKGELRDLLEVRLKNLSLDQIQKELNKFLKDKSINLRQRSCQTTWTEKELAAGPEHLQTEAYDCLQAAVYPASLPFNLPLEEIRAYYGQLGKNRADLLRIFNPLHDSVNQDVELQNYDWAAEYLGLSPEEAGIITGHIENTAVPALETWRLYGFNSSTDSIPDPADSSKILNSNQKISWVELMSSRVDVFLQQSGLSYIELLYLLNTRFINQIDQTDISERIYIISTKEDKLDTYVLSELGLYNMGEASLLEMARFIRLWRKLGWKIYELDRVLSALGLTLSRKEDIVILAQVVQASATLRLPVEKVLPFWCNRFDSTTYTEFDDNPHTSVPSLYERLFLNKVAVDPALLPTFKRLTGFSSIGKELFATLQESIAAALQTDTEQLQLLFDAFENPGQQYITSKGLARLYSHNTLAKSLSLEAEKYLTLCSLLGDPLIGGPSYLSSFLENYELLKSSGLNLQELDYILRHRGVDEEKENLELNNFQTEIKNKLREIVPEAENPVSVEEQRDNLLLQLFSARLDVSLQMAEALLCFEEMDEKGNLLQPLKMMLKDTKFLQGTEDLARQILLRDKIAFLANKWNLKVEELRFLLQHSEAFGLLNLAKLPLAKIAAANLSDDFLNLLQLLKARDMMPEGIAFELLKLVLPQTDTKTQITLLKAQWLQKLEIWGTAVTDLLGKDTELSGGGILKTNFPSDFRNPGFLLRFAECVFEVKALGMPAETISKSLASNLSHEISAAVKNAVKAKYDEERWYTVAKQLRDPLREKQRAALVAYLTARPDPERSEIWKNSNELYEYLLIDVEMLPITMTSRIKQAICSVQLFVDRVLMQLERPKMSKTSPPLTLTTDQAREWNQWRKLYRVWEANRKVFLYPENWLEPELRDDKSTFFKELESTLQQNEVNQETAESAFLAYLMKLDDVARLEIKATYYETENDIWHVLGRTFGSPHQYYYRKRVSGEWTGWEKVEAAIDGDHILMLVWRKRLYLFWLVFTEEREQKAVKMPATGSSMDVPRQRWKIQLAQSEYKQNKWTAKKLAKESVYTDYKDENATTFKILKERMYLVYNEDSDGSLNLMLDSPVTYNYCVSAYWGVYNLSSPNGEPTVSYNSGKNSFCPFNTYPLNMTFIRKFGELDPNGTYYSYWSSSGAVTSKKLLNASVPGKFMLPAIPRYRRGKGPMSEGFFFQDDYNTFFVKHEETYATISGVTGNLDKFTFQTFYHARVDEFIKELGLKGTDGLLNREIQSKSDTMKFEANYDPCKAYAAAASASVYYLTGCAFGPYPDDKVNFEPGGAYSLYNWELFFHIPLYIAIKLSNNQQFEEARRWFHYIFDPTNTGSATEYKNKERFWRFMPFYDEAKKQDILTMDDLLRNISQYSHQVKAYSEKPFNPHAIARLRRLAYMKNVVMKYIDNLLAWADQLFRQDTIESINEATQLYILAAKILGDRPQRVPPRAQAKVQQYSSLDEKLDAFSNAMVEIEAFIPPSAALIASEELPASNMAYFLLDKNEKLLGYWDIVSDRLFKIRHSLNIEGVERMLSLFEPPIDPALLVRAAASGLSLTSVLSDMNASLPRYRFNFMLQKANELCGDVKSLGGAMLAALEKRDAEELALIRQSHESKVLEAVRYIKLSQVQEAEQNLEALQKSKESAEIRLKYYSSRPLLNKHEESYIASVSSVMPLQEAQGGLETAASVAAIVPDFKIGAPTSAGSTFGGSNVSAAMRAASSVLSVLSNKKSAEGSLASAMGGFHRRMDDWKFQAESAAKEIEQLEKQILACEIRLELANRDLVAHDLQVENSREMDDFFNNKFTNIKLYDWMIGQLSTVYFQSYQLAYDLAKRAQKCYEYELGITNASFIQFGYWDGLKKGLLAGEKLQYDLRRLEASYIQENKRGLELQKHISMAITSPEALLTLKRDGKCTVAFPEELFDLDYPGHYFRRIKSVSLTIPCVTGPFVTVSCTLRLLNHKTRIAQWAPGASKTYYEQQDDYKDLTYFRFGDLGDTIACSSAQNDSGLFELNFRDERYLPFEGCGAIGIWELCLTQEKELRQFDYESISDIIFHFKYTAKEGGNQQRNQAASCLSANLAPVIDKRIFSLRHDLPSSWHRFLQNPAAKSEFEFTKEMFPFLAKGRTIKVSQLSVIVKCRQNCSFALLLNDKDDLQISPVSTPFNGWMESNESFLNQTLGSNPLVLCFSLPNDEIAKFEAAGVEDIYMCLDYILD